MESVSYLELVNKREDIIDECGDWTWIKEDNGLWEGPRENWEKEFRNAYLRYAKEKNVVIQAGGGCGMYPRLLSKIFKTVYTFEPDPLSFHCLVNNCQLDEIIKFNVALGDKHELVSVNRTTMSNAGMHTTVVKEDSIIPQLMIDDLALRQCDMILLDIEGGEYKALRGATSTIERLNPLIVVENKTDDIVSFLSGLNYSFKESFVADYFFTYDGDDNGNERN